VAGLGMLQENWIYQESSTKVQACCEVGESFETSSMLNKATYSHHE